MSWKKKVGRWIDMPSFHYLDARLENRFPGGVKRCTNYITIVAFNSRAGVDIDVARFSVLTSTRAQLQGTGKG